MEVTGLERIQAAQHTTPERLENTSNVADKSDYGVNPRVRRKPKRGRQCRLNRKTCKGMRNTAERLPTWLTAFLRFGE